MAWEDLLRGWDGEFLASRFDDASGAWFLIGVHSTALGPAMGGTRMKAYGGSDDAVLDVVRLAGAMTLKNALAGLPFGGGKAVLAVPVLPTGAARRGLLERYGELVDGLRGAYVTACDMNTSEDDMDVVATRTPHVLGCSTEAGGSGSSAPDTAIGVFHAIRAVVRHVTGSDELADRSVAIQGVGAVGAALAALLDAAGATLVVADIDPARTARVAARTGARVVPAEAILREPCDVLSPCATGGILNADTIPTLACRAVAGAANNQLASEQDAERLRARGIVYAPDFAANAGGVIHLAGCETFGWDDARLAARLAAIDATVTDVLQLAEAEGTTTEDAAVRLATERISSAR